MGEWIKENPVLSALINCTLCLVMLFLIIKIYVDKRIDNRIIYEYQKPIVEKLDTLIKYYSDEREYRDKDN